MNEAVEPAALDGTPPPTVTQYTYATSRTTEMTPRL